MRSFYIEGKVKQSWWYLYDQYYIEDTWSQCGLQISIIVKEKATQKTITLYSPFIPWQGNDDIDMEKKVNEAEQFLIEQVYFRLATRHRQ